jgi:lipoyl synthase
MDFPVKEKAVPPLIPMSADDRDLLQEAWDTTRAHHGSDLTFYLPGMIRYGRVRGRYPAVSLTGTWCALQCDHCRGKLLEPMIPVSGPSDLLKKAARLRDRGAHGLLLSGGADKEGRLPWQAYAEAITRIGLETGLFLSAHTGFPHTEDCRLLRASGVQQGLIDVMGDRDTATGVYHLPGLDSVVRSMDAILESGLSFVPHIVAGLHYGNLRGEHRALQLLASRRPSALVFVVLTGLPGTPMESIRPPSPVEVARLIAEARILMPDVPLSLGCERPRNREGAMLESLALCAGITRMAVWSEEAVEQARAWGLHPRFQATCCSLPFQPDFSCDGP